MQSLPILHSMHTSVCEHTLTNTAAELATTYLSPLWGWNNIEITCFIIATGNLYSWSPPVFPEHQNCSCVLTRRSYNTPDLIVKHHTPRGEVSVFLSDETSEGIWMILISPSSIFALQNTPHLVYVCHEELKKVCSSVYPKSIYHLTETEKGWRHDVPLQTFSSSGQLFQYNKANNKILD